MFREFTPIKGSLWSERVNVWLGSLFLGTCALWAAMFIWNITTGSNPITDKLTSVIKQETTLNNNL